MKSIAINHFPIIRFDGREKFLYNPVLKKRYRNRPEERVRLRWLEYLLHQTDHRKSRIGFEAPVDLSHEKNTLRADLLLYNGAMKPEILIECKSESVRLTEKTGFQAARYNTAVGAGHICLTNGVNDFWYRITDDGAAASESPLNETVPVSGLKRDAGWWADRGFISSATPAKQAQRIAESCNCFWSEVPQWPRKYLDFNVPFLDVGLNHFYRVAQLSDDSRLAITFIGSPFTPSYLVAILNQSGQNTGFFAIDLHKLSERAPGSAIRFSGTEQKEMDAHKKLPLFSESFNPAVIENLPNFLITFFD
jgi:hypothetical protein